jgi:hypothetical protein
MMTLKTAPPDDEEARIRAEAIARTLFNRFDLPTMSRVHVQIVLGCSQEDDAVGHLFDAVALTKDAMEDGEISKEEGEKLIKSCEDVMGRRGLQLEEDEEPFQG